MKKNDDITLWRKSMETQILAADDGHVPENYFSGSDIGKLFQIRIVGHLSIEISKNGWFLIVFRMIGVIDVKVLDVNIFPA